MMKIINNVTYNSDSIRKDDLFICALGYESRSLHLYEKIKTIVQSENVLIFYFNDFKDIEFLYNNSFLFDNYIICGTRGWNILDNNEDKKVYERELQRLELSLNDGLKKYGKDKEIVSKRNQMYKSVL